MNTINKLYILLFFSFLLLAVKVQAQEKAIPKAGEGISTFLLRHNRAPKKYYDDFIELNKKKLGKGEVLKMGVAYTIPPAKRSSKVLAVASEIDKSSSTKRAAQKKKSEKTSSKETDSESEEPDDLEESEESKTDEPESQTRTKRSKNSIYEPLFGKSLAHVKVTSNRLAGACFYVVSGHGGPDPGAIGKAGKYELHEDEYAYDIAIRLARNLMEEGAEVRIIIQDAVDGIRDDAYLSNSKRETCMGDPIPLNQVKRLQQRCDKINSYYRKDRKNHKYCRSIFIHVDSRGVGKQTDVFFYHSERKSDSKRLANNMKDMFETKYGKHQPNRGFTGTVSGRNLYVLARSTPASVFVELGNIQNTFDQRRLVMSSNRQAIAKWLMEGFLKDFKTKK